MTEVFGVTARAMSVTCDDEYVVVRGLWWNKRRIPIRGIIAITHYPTIVYSSRGGRIRRKRIGFLASNRYGDPSCGQRHRLQERVEQVIHSAIRDDRRKLDHLDDQSLRDRLHTARAGQSWAAKHHRALPKDADSIWSRHVTTLEAELAHRSTARTSSHHLTP